MGNKSKLKKKQKKKLLKMFLRMMAITLVVCVVVGGALAGCYNTFIKKGTGNNSPKIDAEGNIIEEVDPNKEINTNLAVFGVDKDGTRTDVIFVVNFNSKTGKVKVASLPRDTKVNWSEDQKDKLREDGKYVVSVSKLNEMSAYGGVENIRDYTIDQIEKMLGIKVDNYVLVNIDAFRQIVDAIGGVDMYVPQRLYYTDRAGGLYIDLQEGQQNLDGDKAEQLVRFRHYPQGDVARVEVQQAFLKAFAQKVLSPSIITKVPSLMGVLIKTVTTDVSLTEIPQYYSYLQSFDINNLSFETLPGEGRYEGGVSYYFPDMDKIDEFANSIFFEQPEELAGETGENVVVEDKTVGIEILNGTGVTGAAGTAKERLETEGYTVSTIGNHIASDIAKTTIYAKDITKAEQFKKYYPQCEIKKDDTLNNDIQIILGIDE